MKNLFFIGMLSYGLLGCGSGFSTSSEILKLNIQSELPSPTVTPPEVSPTLSPTPIAPTVTPRPPSPTPASPTVTPRPTSTPVPTLPPNPSASLINGQPLVINGSGFGVKSPAAPVFFDNFESGGLGRALGSSTIGSPMISENDRNITYSNEHVFGGDRSLLVDWTDNTVSGQAAYLTNLNSNEAYFSYRSYAQTFGTTPSDWNWKHAALSSADFGHGDIYHGSICFFEGEVSSSMVAGDDGIPITWWGNVTSRNTWHRREAYLKLSQPAGAVNGRRFRQIDGIGDYTNSGFMGGSFSNPNNIQGITNYYDGADVVTLTSPGVKIQNFLLPFYLRAEHSAKMWIDEVYLDVTLARVEIGNNANWYSTTKRSPQPAVSWSNSSITITLNQSNFTPGEIAYAFVVTADGHIISLGRVGTW